MSGKEHSSEEQMTALKLELKKILDENILLGHRGGNDFGLPHEVLIHKQTLDKLKKNIHKTNQIALELVALENGLELQLYEAVQFVDKDHLPKDYHSSDVFVAAYNYYLLSNKIQKHPEGFFLYRKKNAKAVSHSLVWNDDLLWIKIANDFGRLPNAIDNPLTFIKKQRLFQLQMGRNVERFDQAIAQIESILDAGTLSVRLDPENDSSKIIKTRTESVTNIKDGSRLHIPDEFHNMNEVANNFGFWPKNIMELEEVFIHIIESQRSLGRDITEYQDALKRIKNFN